MIGLPANTRIRIGAGVTDLRLAGSRGYVAVAQDVQVCVNR
jgi:hypothetical protein